MERGRRHKIVVLAIAFALFVALACTSLSKLVFRQEDYIVGSYTDFVISHDGEGQTAVLQSIEDTNYGYEGYIALSVSNFTEDKFSKRDVEFSLRAPTEEEIKENKVTDAWGNDYPLAEHSGNYTVDVEGPAADTALTLEGGKRDTEYLTLRVRRKSSVGEISDTAEEYLTVILETTKPYRDLQVFKINASTSLISVNATSEQDYHGVPQIAVNLKTSRLFVREAENLAEENTYLAKICFTLSGSVVFDLARFKEIYSVEVTHSEGADETSYTFLVSAGSDMNLYFYTSGMCKVTATATIDGEETKISGLKDGSENIVFSIG